MSHRSGRRTTPRLTTSETSCRQSVNAFYAGVQGKVYTAVSILTGHCTLSLAIDSLSQGHRKSRQQWHAVKVRWAAVKGIDAKAGAGQDSATTAEGGSNNLGGDTAMFPALVGP